MKRIVVLLSLFIVLAACNRAEKAEIERLTLLSDELRQESDEKDSLMMYMMDAFIEIEDNLAEVSDRQGSIGLRTANNGEKSSSAKTRILQDIAYINALMDANNQKIADFQKQLNQAKAKQSQTGKQMEGALAQMEQMEKLMSRLKQQNHQKNLEIEALKEELVEMNFELEKVTMAYAKELQTAAEQREKLNTAYYAVGSYKTLKKSNVLTREGGFIGLGGAKALVEDFNKESFITIDITQTTTIDLGTKKAKLGTNHPEGSYEWVEEDKQVKQLVISNPEAFWSISKFLVIITN